MFLNVTSGLHHIVFTLQLHLWVYWLWTQDFFPIQVTSRLTLGFLYYKGSSVLDTMVLDTMVLDTVVMYAANLD